MTVTRVTPGWLALRAAADAAARAVTLLDPLRSYLADRFDPLVIRDLGCGTGSMARWLAPLLPGPQHWVLQDRDPDLVALAGVAAYGESVTVTPLAADLTTLRAADLRDTSLVTASALLDLLTAAEVAALADAAAGRPALFTLSVVGRVELTPADPLDSDIEAAFNAHQRRTVGGRTLLGPDAVAVTTAEFQRRGAAVFSRPSPWRLGPADATLTAEWLRGRVGAAVEQRPDLAPAADTYLDRRLATPGLHVVVHHTDLLALPGATP